MVSTIEQELQNLAFRKHIISEIKGTENADRMDASVRSCDVYNGRIYEHVREHLVSRFGENSTKEMPVVSSINLCKKVVNSRATLYRDEPERTFEGMTDTQQVGLEEIYDGIQFNTKMISLNRYFELQRQVHCYITPQNGELSLKVLKAHQLNVIPSLTDPELGEIYIISSYDITRVTNNVNEKIADRDDEKATRETYIVWSPSYHFTMNGKGEITSESVDNPIAPIVPIVEISSDKDFTYWVDEKNEVSDFCVEFNGALSSLGQIVNLQGFAQAFLKGPKEILPKSLTVGPTKILRLESDAITGTGVEFGFVSPNSDLAGAQSYVESLLSMFLSSQGVDPKSVTGKGEVNNFSSGVERLLAMIKDFEASRDTMAMFKRAEIDIFEVIKAWLNLSRRADILNDWYNIGVLPEQSTVSVSFAQPSSSITDTEVLANIEKKLDLGLMTRAEAIEEIRGIGYDEAVSLMEEIDNEGMVAENRGNLQITNGQAQN